MRETREWCDREIERLRLLEDELMLELKFRDAKFGLRALMVVLAVTSLAMHLVMLGEWLLMISLIILIVPAWKWLGAMMKISDEMRRELEATMATIHKLEKKRGLMPSGNGFVLADDQREGDER